MPSPTSTTVPTLRVSAVASNDAIWLLMMLMISSDRMAMASPSGRGLAGSRPGVQLVPQPLQAAADRGVEESVADLDRQAADDRRVDLGAEVDRGAGHRLDPAPDLLHLVRGQRDGARDRRHDDAPMAVELAGELVRDPPEHGRAAALDEQADEAQRRWRDARFEQGRGHREPLPERHRRVVDDLRRL